MAKATMHDESPGHRELSVSFDEKRIDAAFSYLECQHPGAAVGIAIEGNAVYRKGFGLASMELPIQLSPSIRMRIYSTGKHFTCLAYLLLCEEDRASIDDPIGRFLPELHPVSRNVTMRQLMGNIGGLRDVNDIIWQFSGPGTVASSSEILSLYGSIDDVNFPAGTCWNYNNGGFQMLSTAIERIAGVSFEDVLRTRIFEPVGMYDTLVRRYNTDFVPHSATMHMTTATGGYDRSYFGSAVVGEGGIVSTVDDMLRWLKHMDAPWVGNATTWALIKAPQVLANGFSTGYGLGLMSRRYRGIGVLHHPGSGLGANAQMIKVPSAGLDVVVLVNRYDVSSMLLADKVLEACLPQLEAPPVSSGIPFPTGVFCSPKSGRVIQLEAASADSPWIKEARPMAIVDGSAIPIESDNDGVLRPSDGYEFMKFEIVPVGNRQAPLSLRFSDFGNLDELLRETQSETEDVGAIEGRYRSDATDTEAMISKSEAGLRLRTVGRFGSADFSLECLASGIWRAKSSNRVPWGGILLFDNDNHSFFFSSERTRKLPFRRCVRAPLDSAS